MPKIGPVARAVANRLHQVFQDPMRTFLEKRVTRMASTPEGSDWTESVAREHGALLGLRDVFHERGLPDYPLESRWQKVLGRSDAMELLVTERSLILFDPRFDREARQLVLPYSDILSVKPNWIGQTLLIRTAAGTIRLRLPGSAQDPTAVSAKNFICKVMGSRQ